MKNFHHTILLCILGTNLIRQKFEAYTVMPNGQYVPGNTSIGLLGVASREEIFDLLNSSPELVDAITQILNHHDSEPLPWLTDHAAQEQRDYLAGFKAYPLQDYPEYKLIQLPDGGLISHNPSRFQRVGALLKTIWTVLLRG